MHFSSLDIFLLSRRELGVITFRTSRVRSWTSVDLSRVYFRLIQPTTVTKKPPRELRTPASVGITRVVPNLVECVVTTTTFAIKLANTLESRRSWQTGRRSETSTTSRSSPADTVRDFAPPRRRHAVAEPLNTVKMLRNQVIDQQNRFQYIESLPKLKITKLFLRNASFSFCRR